MTTQSHEMSYTTSQEHNIYELIVHDFFKKKVPYIYLNVCVSLNENFMTNGVNFFNINILLI